MRRDGRWVRGLLIALAMAVGLTTTAPARASTVGSSWEGYTRIAKGVFEIGVDSLLLASYRAAPLADTPDSEVTTTDILFLLGLTPRYFLMDNFALGLNLNFMYQKTSATQTVGQTETETDASDAGFLGFLMANYYLRISGGMFFKPGIGAGYFYAQREVPDPAQANVTFESTISGFAGRLDLGFVFYTSERFNLKAGLDLIARFGQETAEGVDEGETFTAIDAGFGIGFAYSF